MLAVTFVAQIRVLAAIILVLEGIDAMKKWGRKKFIRNSAFLIGGLAIVGGAVELVSVVRSRAPHPSTSSKLPTPIATPPTELQSTPDIPGINREWRASTDPSYDGRFLVGVKDDSADGVKYPK